MTYFISLTLPLTVQCYPSLPVSDVLWLQRDLGLYLVNCFDTFHAAKTLKYPALSLAHLLKYHGNIKLNKKHQLSDWRQRPLPQEMIDYARADTAYLHFLYDSMRKDLFKTHGQEGLQAVLNASRIWCLKRYEKDSFWPLGYRKLLNSEGTSSYPNSNIMTETDAKSGSDANDSSGKKGNSRNSNNSSGKGKGVKMGAPPTLSAEQDLVLSGQSTEICSKSNLYRIGVKSARKIEE